MTAISRPPTASLFAVALLICCKQPKVDDFASLYQQLEGSNAERQLLAAMKLSHQKDRPELLRPFSRLFLSPSSDLRGTALDWFRRVGANARGASPWLCAIANGITPKALADPGPPPSEENRKDAIELLGVIGGARAVDTLIDLLADESQRRRAKLALIHIGESAVPALVQALAPIDASSVHEDALDILQKISPRPTSAILAAATSTTLIESRLRVMDLLPTQFIVDQLGHQHWRIRQRATELLAQKHHKLDDAAHRKIRGSLEDEDIVVRTRIASLLRQRPDARAEDRLLHWYTWSPEDVYAYWPHELPTFYCQVAHALAAMKSKRGFAAIMGNFLRDPLRACPKALARYKTKDALSALRQAAKKLPKTTNTPQSYERLIEALGQIGFKEARPDLERLLTHSDHRLRWAAIRGLSALGDPEAIDALRGLLRDQNSEVRLAAGRTIKQLSRNLTPRERPVR